MNQEISYPAKLLLFGEYSILLGSSALGMPVRAFNARLSYIDQHKGDDRIRAEQSNILLKQLCQYYIKEYTIFNQFLDLDRFRSDVSTGLCLSSTIPQRFGMGSSGALCAALYGCYSYSDGVLSVDYNKEKLSDIREKFILMEDFFHGKSSGFDPLVIYLQKTILLGKEGEAITLKSNPLFEDHKINILLIDSGLPRITAPYVKQFLKQFVTDGVVSPTADSMINLTNACIEKLAGEKLEEFWNNVMNLSRFQLEYLSHLIKAEHLSYWSEGLQSGLFALKLCGSGGGGFLTCLTIDNKATINYFKNNNIAWVEIK